ncbi:acyl-CoA synthetase MbcS [Fictibacillus iocasae]|uniref:Acyl-CoA synthetase MbcS n=1 Tax=Fictibacillus iocasae TaxID=2715437 RepID=A0ABW2NXM1_9BACL
MNLIAPEKYNLSQEMERFAADHHKTALIWKDASGTTSTVTYKELFEQAGRLANAFKRNGLQKGDKALILMPRKLETYAVYLACLKSGIAVIPCSELLRAKDLSYRIQHSEACAVIADSQYISSIDAIEEQLPTLRCKFTGSGTAPGWIDLIAESENESVSFVAPDTHRDDMAFLSYTSGTTGNPKGVVHTHGWGYAHIRTAAQGWLGIKEGDKVWATAGPGWQKWIWSPFVSTLGMGACGFVYNGKFDPAVYLEILDSEQINVLCCTPTEYRLMAKVEGLSHYSLSTLHSAVSAGEPLNREVIETFSKHFGVTVRDGYGQTENTLLVGTMKGMEVRPGSMGKPTPGNRVEVINDEGAPAKAGEVGDIAVHKDSPALFKEYYKDRERTSMAFRGEYYLTGDKAKKDEDGYFWFEGRGDDIIISSGYTIGPFEVEDALVKHHLVKECAVVASPDEIRGSIVKAFVVLRDGNTIVTDELIKELQNHVKELTAPYKYPRRIEFISELPKTTSGKIRRIELRQQEMKKALMQ